MHRKLIPLALILFATASFAAKKFTSEALYGHPLIVGYPPSGLAWSPDGKKLAFLWNEEGNRFKDLYVADLSGRIQRLTDLKNLPRPQREHDDRTEQEKIDEITLDRGLSNPFWSPDGKIIYFTFRGDLWSLPAKAGTVPKRLLETAAGEGNPSLSEDGNWIAYTSENNVFALSTSGGCIVQLTRDGSDDIRNGTGAYDTYLSDVFWAPDSRKLAFVQHDLTGFDRLLIPDYTTQSVEVEEQQREIAGGKLPAIRLGVVCPDSAHKLPQWMDLPAAEQFYLRSLDWSPDSEKLLIEVMPRDMLNRYILIAEVATGKIDTIWQESDDKWIPRNMARVRFGPDGKDVIFGSEMSGWCHLYSIPVGAAGEKIVRALTSGPWEIPSGSWGGGNDWKMSEDRRALLFISGEDDLAERHLYRIDLPEGKKRQLTAEKGWIRSFEISRDGSRAALIYGDLDHPYDLYWCDTKSEKPLRRLTYSQPEAFSEYDWFKPEYITIPTSDGLSFPAKLWLPDEDKLPAPLIVYIHGAGYHQNVERAAWGYEDRFHRMLVQEGFAVVDIDYRGSSGYGRDWRVGIYRHTGGKDLDDAVDAANFCIEKGWSKPGVGIWGWSYGGFMTNMAMFRRPDVFKVGCSIAAVNDWKNYNLEYTTQRFKDPDQDPEAYKQSSPITFASGLEGKLLIIHGLKDDNVHAQDTIQLIDTLIRLGKQFDLLLYPRERHGFSRDESDIHVMQAILDYFKEHLR